MNGNAWQDKRPAGTIRLGTVFPELDTRTVNGLAAENGDDGKTPEVTVTLKAELAEWRREESAVRDRYGCCEIHAGDTVSIFSQVSDHDGVGDVTVIGTDGTVAVEDAVGRTAVVKAADVNVDWTEYED